MYSIKLSPRNLLLTSLLVFTVWFFPGLTTAQSQQNTSIDVGSYEQASIPSSSGFCFRCIFSGASSSGEDRGSLLGFVDRFIEELMNLRDTMIGERDTDLGNRPTLPDSLNDTYNANDIEVIEKLQAHAAKCAGNSTSEDRSECNYSYHDLYEIFLNDGTQHKVELERDADMEDIMSAVSNTGYVGSKEDMLALLQQFGINITDRDTSITRVFNAEDFAFSDVKNISYSVDTDYCGEAPDRRQLVDPTSFECGEFEYIIDLFDQTSRQVTAPEEISREDLLAMFRQQGYEGDITGIEDMLLQFNVPLPFAALADIDLGSGQFTDEVDWSAYASTSGPYYTFSREDVDYVTYNEGEQSFCPDTYDEESSYCRAVDFIVYTFHLNDGTERAFQVDIEAAKSMLVYVAKQYGYRGSSEELYDLLEDNQVIMPNIDNTSAYGDSANNAVSFSNADIIAAAADSYNSGQGMMAAYSFKVSDYDVRNLEVSIDATREALLSQLQSLGYTGDIESLEELLSEYSITFPENCYDPNGSYGSYTCSASGQVYGASVSRVENVNENNSEDGMSESLAGIWNALMLFDLIVK